MTIEELMQNERSPTKQGQYLPNFEYSPQNKKRSNKNTKKGKKFNKRSDSKIIEFMDNLNGSPIKNNSRNTSKLSQIKERQNASNEGDEDLLVESIDFNKTKYFEDFKKEQLEQNTKKTFNQKLSKNKHKTIKSMSQKNKLIQNKTTTINDEIPQPYNFQSKTNQTMQGFKTNQELKSSLDVAIGGFIQQDKTQNFMETISLETGQPQTMKNNLPIKKTRAYSLKKQSKSEKKKNI
eukprot:403367059